MAFSNAKPEATSAGNANQLGVITPGKTQGTYENMGLDRPGKITHGPAKNKVRIHLVSSKGKVPAAVYAEAIAFKQKIAKTKTAQDNGTARSVAHVTQAQFSQPHGVAPAKNMQQVKPGEPTAKGSHANVQSEQLKNPPGVAKRPNPSHQNNPALAGRFTPQAVAYANQMKAPMADNPADSPGLEKIERKRGMMT